MDTFDHKSDQSQNNEERGYSVRNDEQDSDEIQLSGRNKNPNKNNSNNPMGGNKQPSRSKQKGKKNKMGESRFNEWAASQQSQDDNESPEFETPDQEDYQSSKKNMGSSSQKMVKNPSYSESSEFSDSDMESEEEEQ